MQDSVVSGAGAGSEVAGAGAGAGSEVEVSGAGVVQLVVGAGAGDELTGPLVSGQTVVVMVTSVSGQLVMVRVVASVTV